MFDAPDLNSTTLIASVGYWGPRPPLFSGGTSARLAFLSPKEEFGLTSAAAGIHGSAFPAGVEDPKGEGTGLPGAPETGSEACNGCLPIRFETSIEPSPWVASARFAARCVMPARPPLPSKKANCGKEEV
jgi:hypothetical protein